MTLYSYVCEDNHETNIFLPMLDEHPKDIECEHCKKKAFRNFLSSNIIIPDYMKSQSVESGGDSYANLDNLKSRFKHARRPSGRQKVYF